MVSITGLNLSSSRNVSSKSLGFGNGEESSAQKIAGAANQVEDTVLKPALEGGVLVSAAVVSGNKAGGKLNTWLEGPIETISKAVGGFLAQYTKSEGIIGRTLSKCKPLTEIIAKQGANAAAHLTGEIKGVAQIAIKGLAGLIGLVAVAKEMPNMENAAGKVFDDLGSAALAASTIN